MQRPCIAACSVVVRSCGSVRTAHPRGARGEHVWSGRGTADERTPLRTIAVHRWRAAAAEQTTTRRNSRHCTSRHPRTHRSDPATRHRALQLWAPLRATRGTKASLGTDLSHPLQQTLNQYRISCTESIATDVASVHSSDQRAAAGVPVAAVAIERPLARVKIAESGNVLTTH